jgi:hypothetical protein
MPDHRLERLYFEQLKALIPDFAGRAVHRAESPDFIVDFGSRTVGVELTEFHLAPLPGKRPHRQVRTLRWRVVERAAALHRDLGGTALYLHASFDDACPGSKHDVAPLADRLANAVLTTQVPRSISDGPGELSWDRLPYGVNHVWFWPSIDGVDLLWQPVDGGWVAPIPAAELAAIIASKGRKITSYRASCDEVWLVVVHNVWSSAPAELRSDAIEHVYASPFDRVLWFDAHAPAFRELKTSAA